MLGAQLVFFWGGLDAVCGPAGGSASLKAGFESAYCVLSAFEGMSS